MLRLITIITITYNNPKDFKKTYDSLRGFREGGGKHIVINGGNSVKHLVKKDCFLIEEKDEGIYDALNKGIYLTSTPYFMLIHSGDILVASNDILEKQVSLMKDRKLDILLNDCILDFGKSKRPISSKFWRPWMFKLGAAPPHPPTIYKYSSVKNIKYDTNHPIIADFDYLERIFKYMPKYDRGGKTLIHMSAGGKTSSGLSSFFTVTKEFRKLKGILVSFCFIFTRPLIKIIQMI